MIRLSTGMRTGLIWDTGIMQMLYNGCIRVYSGTQPASADLAPTGTLLAEITSDGVPFGSSGAGLKLIDASATSLKHDSNWVMRGLATGTAGWWRFIWWDGDEGMNSADRPRLDAAVADSVVGIPTEITPATYVEGVTFTFNYTE